MGKGSCQRQPLRLTAGKPRAAAADDGIQPRFHGKHFMIQRRRGKIRLRVLIASAEDVILDGVGTQLRVVPQISHGRRDLAGGEGGKLGLPEFRRAAVGRFAEEHPPEGGLAAGHRPGNADDIPRMGRQAQPGENRLVAVGKGKILKGHVHRRRNGERLQRLRGLHQRLNALP